MLFWLVTALLLLTLPGRRLCLIISLDQFRGLGLAIELDLKFQSWNAFCCLPVWRSLLLSAALVWFRWSKKMVDLLQPLGTATASASLFALQMTGERGLIMSHAVRDTGSAVIFG